MHEYPRNFYPLLAADDKSHLAKSKSLRKPNLLLKISQQGEGGFSSKPPFFSNGFRIKVKKPP